MLMALTNLAFAYLDTEDKEKTIEYFELLYKASLEKYGESNYDTIQALYYLALTYGEIGSADKAIELFELGHSICTRRFGEEHSMTVNFKDGIKNLKKDNF